MKYQTTILFTAFILIGAYPAYGDSSHHHSTQVAQVENSSQGTAMGLAAAEKHLYWGTLKAQWAIGAANVDDNTALSFGIGKRKGDILYSGSVTIGEETGYSFGAAGRF